MSSLWDFLQTREARLTIMWALFAVLVAIGFFVIRRVPKSKDDDTLTTSDMMSTFREMHAQGELSDEEYREIKTRLAARFRQQVRTNDDPE